MKEKKPKCRVNWGKPCRAGTVCNYVDELTNECKQTDWKRCPCGGIVRYPRFEELPWKESDRVAAIHAHLNKDVIAELERRSTEMFDSGVPMIISITEVVALLKECPEEDRKKREAVKKAGDRPRPPCEECIYQSQSAEHDALIAAQATAAENKRVLDIIDKLYDNIKVAHRHDTSNYSEGLLDGIDLSITEIKNESLRLAQPEPTERDPE